MKKYTLPIKIVFISVSLSACTMMESDPYADYGYQPSNMQRYVQYDYRTNNYQGPVYRSESAPIATESYHVSAGSSPRSFKDRDETWVASQNPAGYTIQIANGDKASEVAGELNKAPKSDRKAQVKYMQDGKIHYKGLYGSYENEQAAQEAFNALPQDVKQKASISNWKQVQTQ
jgi:septal ring-binding cell division protein DamX